jgi:hypothetical protein
MFMQLRGGGIGHKATWEWNDIMLSDVGKAVDDEIEEGAEEMGEAGTNESGGGEVSEDPAAAQEDAEEDDWEDLDLGVVLCMARLEAPGRAGPSRANEEGSWGLTARLQYTYAGLGRGPTAQANNFSLV